MTKKSPPKKKVVAKKPAAPPAPATGLQFVKTSNRKVKAGFKFTGVLENGFKVEAEASEKSLAADIATAKLEILNTYDQHCKAVAREKRKARRQAKEF